MEKKSTRRNIIKLLGAATAGMFLLNCIGSQEEYAEQEKRLNPTSGSKGGRNKPTGSFEDAGTPQPTGSYDAGNPTGSLDSGITGSFDIDSGMSGSYSSGSVICFDTCVSRSCSTYYTIECEDSCILSCSF